MAAKKKARRKKAEPNSRGIVASDVMGEPPAAITELARAVEVDGGAALAPYREPLSGQWLLLAALPIEFVAPTPYQRDLSEAHLKRLTDMIDKVGTFLDPIIATREGEKKYWTPNGNHRRAAMTKLGARTITALIVPDSAIATKILALNTEKSHNLREKSLEVIRMARALAEGPKVKECDLALEFEEPLLLTLGICYQRNGRFSGGAYRPALKRVEEFMDRDLTTALAARDQRADLLMALDEKIGEILARLKERGFKSPYLRSFVTARVNPIRFAKTVTIGPDELIRKMSAAAAKFDTGKITEDQVASAAGWGAADEE